jgi:hypothetical protein
MKASHQRKLAATVSNIATSTGCACHVTIRSDPISHEQKKRQAEGDAESPVECGRDQALAPQNGSPETRMRLGADIVRPITMVRSPPQPPRPAIPAEKATRRATQQEVTRNHVAQRPSPHRQRPPNSILRQKPRAAADS